MKTTVVTGGSGKAGRAVVDDLTTQGFDVLNADIAATANPDAPDRRVDLTDLGQTVEALHGADAVVHLAAIPAPRIETPERTFYTNITSTYNVFHAARVLSIKRVVWASSETTLGLPFEREKPAYAPIDEQHPLYPESSYALSKVLSEEMARQFARWEGMSFVGLRISNIMEEHDYERFPEFWDDPYLRKWNLWGYVDARDVAQACRLGLEAEIDGAEAFIIAAADTVMTLANADLMEQVYPGVPFRGTENPHDTLLAIVKARAVLGYEPQYSWRQYISEE